jgi:hypothetical protein
MVPSHNLRQIHPIRIQFLPHTRRAITSSNSGIISPSPKRFYCAIEAAARVEERDRASVVLHAGRRAKALRRARGIIAVSDPFFC